jgi:hypothetical protein
MAQDYKKKAEVKEVVDQLRDLNIRIERLLAQIPTTDDKVLSELDLLVNRLQRTLMIQTTKEKGTMFFEQASGKAMSLKDRYLTLLAKGKLRKTLS